MPSCVMDRSARSICSTASKCLNNSLTPRSLTPQLSMLSDCRDVKPSPDLSMMLRSRMPVWLRLSSRSLGMAGGNDVTKPQLDTSSDSRFSRRRSEVRPRSVRRLRPDRPTWRRLWICARRRTPRFPTLVRLRQSLDNAGKFPRCIHALSVMCAHHPRSSSARSGSAGGASPRSPSASPSWSTSVGPGDGGASFTSSMKTADGLITASSIMPAR
mmetsp:Transcript_22247/g.68551  ORF Transcript_22247/g.68551 Transcript_22247/m.68551 type:complete len:214 (+) Transcript_22247:867-1508(+)